MLVKVNRFPFSIYSIVLALIAIALLLPIPWLVDFPTVVEEIYKDKTWAVDLSRELYYPARMRVIAFGFVGVSISFIVFLTSTFIRPPSPVHHLLNLTLFSIAFAVGFKDYAYLANGLFDVFITGSRTSQYDPKSILPMAYSDEAGQYWRDSILWFYLFSLLFVPFLLYRTASTIMRKTILVPANLAIAVATVVFIFTFIVTPNYLGWLLD